MKQIMRKNKVEFITAKSGVCLLSSPSGSVSGNVRRCLGLALGSLFNATRDPQSAAVCFKFGWSLMFCPAGFLSQQGPGVAYPVSKSTSGTTSTCL